MLWHKLPVWYSEHLSTGILQGKSPSGAISAFRIMMFLTGTFTTQLPRNTLIEVVTPRYYVHPWAVPPPLIFLHVLSLLAVNFSSLGIVFSGTK